MLSLTIIQYQHLKSELCLYGQTFQIHRAHCIAKTLGPEKSSVLSLFHAFTGCGTFSAFHGKCKRSAWDTWTAYDEPTDAFAVMMDPVQAVHFDVFMPVIQRFVVVMYDRTSSSETLDEARLHFFAQKEKQIEAIPPTEAALLQRTKSASKVPCRAQLYILAAEIVPKYLVKLARSRWQVIRKHMVVK